MELDVRKPGLIIFDCDGVLVDSEVLSCQCLSESLVRCGIDVDAGRALDLFLGRSTRAIVHHYEAEGRPLPHGFPADLRTRVRRSFETSLRAIPGVEAVLSDLPTPHCVASSSDLERVSFSLALTGLTAHFDGRLFTSEMVTRGKPNPDLFLYAADKMQVAPGRTLVVEDSISGVMAAKAAGMTVWGFAGGSHYRSRDGRAILRDAGADRVFDRMTDFWAEG